MKYCHWYPARDNDDNAPSQEGAVCVCHLDSVSPGEGEGPLSTMQPELYQVLGICCYIFMVTTENHDILQNEYK